MQSSWGAADPATQLRFGPGIADWPAMPPLPEALLLDVAAVIDDPVTTTDELIPSGEISSLRSNPMKLAEYALWRREPEYVPRAKAVQALEAERRAAVADGRDAALDERLTGALDILRSEGLAEGNTIAGLGAIGFGSLVYARKPGDGSAREQAASSQKVLGGWANVAVEYATKRYASNLVNWGMLPLLTVPGDDPAFAPGDYLYLPGIRAAVESGSDRVEAYVVRAGDVRALTLRFEGLDPVSRRILLAGCLINDYRNQKQ